MSDSGYKHGPRPPNDWEVTVEKKACGGDPASQIEVLEHFERLIYSVAAKFFFKDIHLVDDAVQEVFIKLLNAFGKGQVDPDRDLVPFILTVSRRTCIDLLRKKKRWSAEFGGDINEAEDGSSSGQLEDQLDAKAIWSIAMEQADECTREIVRRRFVEDNTFREISEAMTIPLNSVYARLQRFLHLVREALCVELKGDR